MKLTVGAKAVVISPVAWTTRPWRSPLDKIIKIPIRSHPKIFWTVEALSSGGSFDKIIQVAVTSKSHSVSIPLLNKDRYFKTLQYLILFSNLLSEELFLGVAEIVLDCLLGTVPEVLRTQVICRWWAEWSWDCSLCFYCCSFEDCITTLPTLGPLLPWSLGPRELLSVALAASLLSLRQCYNTLLHHSLPSYNTNQKELF